MDCCNNKKSIFSRIKDSVAKKDQKENENCATKKVALIGNPNVGKSVIFNNLTGAYVTVSNYPGTTVEISRGWYTSDSGRFEIVDTPGMYSLMPITEEEQVSRSLLMNEKPDLILHIIDAKNISRMLPLTLQLLEAGFQVVLVLNIMDEADALGIRIDRKELQKILGTPVLEASAALNKGLDEIRKIIEEQIENAA